MGIFMGRKLNMEVARSREVERGREREKYQKKLDWYLFDLLVTQDFQL